MNRKFTNEEKAKIYNQMLFQFNKLQEQVRLIKAEDINITPQNQRKIDMLEAQMRKIYNDTQKLYN